MSQKPTNNSQYVLALKANPQNATKVIFAYENPSSVYEESTTFFNEKLLNQLLCSELSIDNKKELIRALYTSIVSQYGVINDKTDDASSNVQFDDSIYQISSYSSQIVDKLKGHVTLQEFEASIGDLEDVFALDNSEKLEVRRIATPKLLSFLGLQTTKPKM